MTPGISVDPPAATVSEKGTWRVVCRVGDPGLEQGAQLMLQLAYHSQLRFAWQTSDPEGEGYVTVAGPPDTRLEASTEGPDTLQVELRDGAVREGQSVVITIGDREFGGPGLQIWPVAHDLEFVLIVHPKAARHEFTIPVRPGPAKKLLVKCPTTAKVGDEIPVLVRAVDAQGNTARGHAGRVHVKADPCIEVGGEVRLTRGIGRVQAKVLSPSSEAQRITVHEPAGALAQESNPMELVEEPEERIFWGDLHCHTNWAQALESPDFLYTYAKEEEALDFICHTEHDAGTEERWIGPRWRDWQPPVASVPEYVEATWEARKQLVREHYEPGKFVTLLGYEWASNLYGHANVYYPTDDAPIFYPDNFWQEDYTPAALWEQLEGLEAFIVPHHPSHRIRSEPGGFVSGWDWDYYDESRLRLVEIYSKHGNSEYFGCPRPISDQVAEGCAQAALARGHRIGFVADTDTHASRPGSDLAGDLYVRQGGITAVFAERLDRRSIFDALRNRRCYGATGQRIIVRFWVNDAFMGEETQVGDATAPKSVRFQVEGTAPLESVTVVKNNQDAHRETPRSASLTAEFIDRAPTTGTDFYYLRVIQEDGEMAWASPIWVSQGPGRM